MKYIAKTGISYKFGNGERRAEIGEEVPAAVIKRSPWLVERGHVVVEQGGDDGEVSR